MQLHDLQRNTPNRKKKRVGRGGKRGKTSGRGHKGQKARAGHSIRPEERDMIKKLPKLRGHGVNRARTVHDSRVSPAVVNLAAVEAAFNDGDTVSPETLKEKGLIRARSKKLPPVKVLGNGDVKKKLSFTDMLYSESAKEKITKTGGSIAT